MDSKESGLAEDNAAARPAGKQPHPPAVVVVSVGETGSALAVSLKRAHIDGGASFIYAWSSPHGAGADGGVVGPDASPFASARLVVILASAMEDGALRTCGMAGRAAHAAGVPVVAMFAQPPFPPGGEVKAVADEIADCIDSLVFVPEFPHATLLGHLANVYLAAVTAGQSGAPRLPVGAEFLDVRGAFADTGETFAGVGLANRADRARYAARLAVAAIGARRLMMAEGLLIVVAGARALRLQEIAAAAFEVQAATSGDATGALAMHYDDRLGDTVRVTVIAAESDS